MSVKGPALLREKNQKTLLSLLRKYKQTSRQDLAKLMGVSKNTISIIVDQFISEGVIREVGVKDSRKVGRPKILIELNSEMYKVIGITIVHQKIEYVVTDYSFNTIIDGYEQIESNNTQEILARISHLINRIVNEYEGVIGAGIGIPGIVNSEMGIVYESTKLQWKDVDVLSVLKGSISVPIIVQNNVKMTSLCASLTKAIDEDPSFFYVRIGEGIGGAFFQEGRIWDGVSWTSGEIGHISVNPAGPLCGCGQKGCLEKMISYNSFSNWLSGLKDDVQVLNEDSINEQMGLFGNYLGIALISIINIINPGIIVIDSPYNCSTHFKESVLNYLSGNALEIPLDKTSIKFNEDPYSQSLGSAIAVVYQFEK